jgi:hypothetical protein
MSCPPGDLNDAVQSWPRRPRAATTRREDSVSRSDSHQAGNESFSVSQNAGGDYEALPSNMSMRASSRGLVSSL